jgi:hypothetical protein
VAKFLVLALVLLVIGCAGSANPDRASPWSGPQLPAPGSGQYCLSRAGAPVGIERYTVTATGASWAVVGHQAHYGGAQVELHYRLWADPRSGQVEGLDLRVGAGGLSRRVRGIRRGPWLEIEGEGAGGAFRRRVPWSPGTWIGFPSPLFEALALGARDPNGASRDRVVLFYPPELSPVVRLAEIEPRGAEGEDRRFLIRPGEGLAPVGLWLGPDGYPTRVRRYLGDAAPLESVRSSSCAAPPPGSAKLPPP